MFNVVQASAVPSKVCAACGGRYPGDALFCPTDGTPLQSAGDNREAPDPYLGQEISGHIEIRELVGVGAMGRVYRAFQRGIDRDVAVKILHRELSANAQLVSRFTREAKVASRLQHPNVVQVLLAGQLPDRALYMVMEYLDGLSLQGALSAAGGALPLPRALHIVLQLCEAVGEAHAQGIVHRDLKPENVMLVRRGSDPDYVKVLDFGIARINWGDQSVATAAGLIFGTARYISPEGAQGSVVGPASDVYSIGTLLYQMLSGRTPFDGDQAVALLVQQIHDSPAPLRSLPSAGYVPEPIARIVMASLDKDPGRREPDARALGQALFDAAKLSGISPDELSRPILRRTASSPRLNGASPSADGTGRLTGATAKWEPPSEFHARLADATRGSSPDASPRPSGVVDRPPRDSAPRAVDETLDDGVEPQPRLGSSPALPPAASVAHARDGSGPELPRTAPGAPEPPVRTHYTPPAPEATTSEPREVAHARPASHPELSSAPSMRVVDDASRPGRGWLLVAFCFVLGAVIAAGWAWKVGKFGPGVDAEQERFTLRATDAMFKNRFHEPPGDNVKDITDEGLRRWPGDHRMIDIRVRAANELTTQAIAQRAVGDVLEALKLAKLAHDLDPNNASTKRLVEQYEAELASFSPSAAPTLARPPDRPPVAANGGKAGPPPIARIDHKALVDVSNASPRLGQTVDLVARVAPAKGELENPGFTITGPGIPGGVQMRAQPTAPGTFKASYAFLEPGRFEVAFTTQAEGKLVTAKRTVNAGGAPPSTTPTLAPSAPPSPAAPTGSVKWM